MKKKIIFIVTCLLFIFNIGFNKDLSAFPNNLRQAQSEGTIVCGKQHTFNPTKLPGANEKGVWTSTCEITTVGQTTTESPNMTIVVPNYMTCTYTWTISKADTNEVIDEEIFQITFKPKPTPFAGQSQIVCGNETNVSTTSSVDGSSIFWAPAVEGQVSIPINNAFTTKVTANFYGTHTINLTETKDGCTGTSSVNITFIKKPEPTFENETATICGNSTELKVLTEENPTGIWTAYEIDGENETLMNPAPAYSPNATSPEVTATIGNLTGSHKIVKFVWKEKNSSGSMVCEGEAAKTITFGKIPTASVINDNFDECTDCITLAANAPQNSFGNGKWTAIGNNGENIDGSFSVAGNEALNTEFCVNSPSAFGNNGKAEFNIYWTVSNQDAPTCSSDAIVTVKLYQTPKANGGLKIDAICGNDYELKAVYNIPQNTNYTPIGKWDIASSPGNSQDYIATFTNPNTNNTNVHVNKVGTWEFSFSEANAFAPSCKSLDTVKIEFIEKPAVNAGQDFEVCGLETNLNGTSGSTTNNGAWNNLSGSDFENPNDPKTKVSVLNEGSYTYTWQETASSTLPGTNLSCGGTASVDVTFWKKPEAYINPDFLKDSVCGDTYSSELSFNQMQLVGNLPSGSQVGHWYTVSPNVQYGDINSNNTYAKVPDYGTYEFKWIIKTGSSNPDFNCSSEAGPIVVKFKKIPKANAGEDIKICGKKEGKLAAVKSVAESKGIWSTPSVDNITFEDISSPTTKIFSTIYNTPSIPSFKLTWTENNGGCTDKDDLNVIFTTTPTAELDIIPPKCLGEPAIIKAKDDKLTQYTWDFFGGLVEKSFTNEAGGVYANLVYWKDGKTSHKVSLQTAEANCISIPTILEFDEPEKPLYTATIIKDTCKLGKGGIIFSTEGEKEFAYFWETPDVGPPVGTSIPNGVEELPAGKYNVKSTYQSYNSTNPTYQAQYITYFGTDLCEEIVEYEIPTMGLIKPKIEISSEIVLEDLTAPEAKVVFLNKTDYDGIKKRCIWQFGDDSSVSNCDEMMEHIYTTAGCFNPILIVINKELPECKDTAKLATCIRVKDDSKLEVPNVFSPNGDGINDYFQVKAVSLKSFKGQIFNRWGTLIYTWENWEDQDAGWDGKINGGSTEASSGVYYYVIKAEGLDKEPYKLNGPLHLMK